MTKIPELKTGQMITLAYFIGILVILFIVYKLLGKVGIIKTSAKRKAEAASEQAVESLRSDDYFNPAYYKGKQFKSIGANAANLYAQYLHEALSGVGTDEELIYSTFGKLYNKTNISEVAASYFLQYGKDLQAGLLDDLNKKEAVPLMDIINNLPER